MWGGTTVITPSEDSIDNVKIVSNSYDAENGRFSGAQIQITSKGGSNQYHGSAFFTAHRPGLNAYQRYNGDGNSVLRDPSLFNQYGGSFGGPIWKNKIFAFFNYETIREHTNIISNQWGETAAFDALAPTGSIAATIVNRSFEARQGILPDVCVEWETAAQSAANYGLRVVNLRIGIVLGHGGGALAQMLPFFRMGTGGRIGTGRQWMSWIHLDDLIGLLLLALSEETVSGAVNGTAPNPVTNAEFTHALAEVIHRPAVLPVPEFGLRMLYGEMAQVLLEGQRVMPEAATRAGYQFRYPDLRTALKSAT